MKTGKKGLDLIKSFEGYRLDAYQCPAKVWTIGYGHTGKVGLKSICKGMKISVTTAESLLKSDLKSFEKTVTNLVKVKLTQNQFDALVSFTYNVGSANLKASTLLRKLNDGDYSGAAEQFEKWNKVNGEVLSGLTRRRKDEKDLFCSK
jgi:GH24 family phage-related lysozyme (muramidase)